MEVFKLSVYIIIENSSTFDISIKRKGEEGGKREEVKL